MIGDHLSLSKTPSADTSGACKSLQYKNFNTMSLRKDSDKLQNNVKGDSWQPPLITKKALSIEMQKPIFRDLQISKESHEL
jgi:hypothetical protein